MEPVDVLLIYPPYRWEIKYPPIGLAYLAACLEQEGNIVRIIDLNVTPMSTKALAALVSAARPCLAGISFMTPQYDAAIGLCRVVKQASPRSLVVAGGPHPSAAPETVLGEGSAIDVAAVGEGEETIGRLLGAARGEERLQDIPGIVYMEDDEYVHTPPAAPILDLDLLPRPAWHLLPVASYCLQSYGTNGARTLILTSSRGCPYQCVFCDSHSIFGRRHRTRSPASIVDEIVFLRKEYGVEQVDFADDTVSVNRKWLSSLCEALRDARLPVTWTANARVNSVSLDLLHEMRNAGCVKVDFGVETGDPDVLKAIRKSITLDQALEAHSCSHKAGLVTGTFFMVGNLGETRESAQKTVEFARKIQTDFPSVAIATPFPGTELFRIAESRGWLLSKSWGRYDTTPSHAGREYEPVMRTENMTASEILEAYYFVASRFVKRRFEERYGRRFWVNPAFYRERRVFGITRPKELAAKMSFALRVLRGK